MKTFKQFTVGTLIEYLEGRDPEQRITDLSADVGSYRGYYSEVAIQPDSLGTTVGILLSELKGKLNTTMHGYKGGEYAFQESCDVYVAPYGDTGPALIGFQESASGRITLIPVVAEGAW